MSAPRFSTVRVGDALAEERIDITPSLIVTGAIASRDFYPVHHDRDFAQSLGSPDIFMNILTTNGLVGRFVTDWCGPRARLLRLAIRLGAPNFPGDCMRLRGEVVERDEGERTVTVEAVGQNSLGEHVKATALVALPP